MKNGFTADDEEIMYNFAPMYVSLVVSTSIHILFLCLLSFSPSQNYTPYGKADKLETFYTSFANYTYMHIILLGRDDPFIFPKDEMDQRGVD
jgi:hypothetical protein